VLSSQTETFFSQIASGNPSTLAQPAAGEQSTVATDLLFEFLTSPFGNAEQARELLSLIEGRSIYDTELERGQFCFQIAFYFLSCLAIAAHVDDPVLQKGCINRLYDRVRGFHACTDLTARFSDFIVAASERQQFATGLRELLQKTGERHGDISRVAITRLGIFDLVGLRRLYEYHGVMGPPDSQLRFYLVAEELLLHFGGKAYHPSIVAVITDLLSANYNILSKIVLSASRPIDTRDSALEKPFVSLPLDVNMPDIANKQPSKVYLAGNYRLLLVENVGPIGARGAIKFRYVLVLCDRRRRLPACFVTLENSTSISNVLCVFEPDGSHSNYGVLRGDHILNEFIENGIHLMRYRFDLGKIEEDSSHLRPHRPGWKFTYRSGDRPQAANGGTQRNAAMPRSGRVPSPALAPAVNEKANLRSSQCI
jgi:hypothetical protein